MAPLALAVDELADDVLTPWAQFLADVAHHRVDVPDVVQLVVPHRRLQLLQGMWQSVGQYVQDPLLGDSESVGHDTSAWLRGPFVARIRRVDNPPAPN